MSFYRINIPRFALRYCITAVHNLIRSQPQLQPVQWKAARKVCVMFNQSKPSTVSQLFPNCWQQLDRWPCCGGGECGLLERNARASVGQSLLDAPRLAGCVPPLRCRLVGLGVPAALLVGVPAAAAAASLVAAPSPPRVPPPFLSLPLPSAFSSASIPLVCLSPPLYCRPPF